MTPMQLAPRVKARRALVFLDGEPSRRLAHALRQRGFEVRTGEAEAPFPALIAFLQSARPGELLLVRWPAGSAWVPSAFTGLISEFARRLGDSCAAALLLVVDFGWVLHSGPDEPGHARLDVPGDPPVAAAALTASLGNAAERPGPAPSLTELLADGLLARRDAVTVSDLYGMAKRSYEELGSDLRAIMFSHGDIEDVTVSAGRTAGEAALAHTAAMLRAAGEREVPESAAEIVARVHDLHLSEPARRLLPVAALLGPAEELTADHADLLDAREGLDELVRWGLAPAPHRAVREFGGSLLSREESERLAWSLRRMRARRTAVQPRARLTPDRWTLDDRLGHRVYAEAMAAFIRHPDTQPPLTIGVKGPWGVGKTSLMRMVQELLDPGATGGSPVGLRPPSRRRGPVTNAEILDRVRRAVTSREDRAVPDADGDWRPTVWFNPWMYQDGEQVWAGLAHEIITQVTQRLSPVERERFWLELNLTRVDRESVRRQAYQLALTRLVPVGIGLAGTGLLSGASLAAEQLLPWLKGTAAAIGAAGAVAAVTAGTLRIARFFGESAGGSFSGLMRPPDPLGLGLEHDYRGRAGFLHLVHTDLRNVLDLVATPERPLVVFVDDLDRCSSGTVAQVIEAINLFLAGEFPNCVFVLAMEPDVVAAHVENAYRGLRLPDGVGWRFLEKIVQLPLSVPQLDDERLPHYLRALLGLPSGEAPPSLEPVREEEIDKVEAAIRRLSPTSATLEHSVRHAQAALGARPEEVRRAADRVFGDLYSDENAFHAIEATLPWLDLRNPREVKRYLNVFRFYSFVTYRRQLAGAPRTPDAAVAKLAALTVGWPHLLSTLSTEAHPGATVLDRLERAALRGDGDAWLRALMEAEVDTHGAAEEALRLLLATRPPVAALAALFL
ncbi:P-loop NTPase fold protein [Nonomuraea sp. NPDC059194]|uniref:KAP family P-loop NTPase fold protein n=1 Tax=Nonomuraea sp. NPDC059194 TaxID=3346764 RepID=UPI00369976AF